MSEDKNTLLNTLAEPISNAVKNITDKPTQNIGTTLADIWYLVFGGISQAAEKRKLKYSYALQEFEQELKEKIEKIPEDELVEPDIQTVAHALEASKYCIDKEELRHMFAELIASSLNTHVYEKVHPSFVHTIANLSVLDAKILYCCFNDINISFIKPSLIISSLEMLHKLGILKDKTSRINNMDYNDSLIYLSNPYMFDTKKYINVFYSNYHFQDIEHYHAFYNNIYIIYPEHIVITHEYSLSEFGSSFAETCIDRSIQFGKPNWLEFMDYYFSIHLI